jgi:hypothetical protein
MRTFIRWSVGLAFAVSLALTASADGGRTFFVTDDCDPNDPDWGPVGGCFRDGGEVTRAEFRSANQNGFPGHPSWRIVRPYVADLSDDEVRVRNTGGRVHTFTEVARFGGGYNPGQNPQSAIPAPECATVDPATGALSPAPSAVATTLAPGAGMRIEGLTPGTHNFQCCIHPWMRSTVKISNEDDGH